MPSMDQESFPRTIGDALDNLRRGGVVAVPTETVYGLCAQVEDEHAVRRIFFLKGRSLSAPLGVLVESLPRALEWATEIPEVFVALARRCTPGPVTFLLPRKPGALPHICGYSRWVGVRIPAHPLALALLAQCNGALVATSANPHGLPPAVCAAQVRTYFPAHLLPCIVDGGDCTLAISSTIVSYCEEKHCIYVHRQGSLSPQDIGLFSGCTVRGESPLNSSSAC